MVETLEQTNDFHYIFECAKYLGGGTIRTNPMTLYAWNVAELERYSFPSLQSGCTRSWLWRFGGFHVHTALHTSSPWLS